MLIFSCLRCDCPAFTLPADLTPASEATCVRCRASLGTWSVLKQRLEQYLADCDEPVAASAVRHRGASGSLEAHERAASADIRVGPTS